jgi:hypothetical protein
VSLDFTLVLRAETAAAKAELEAAARGIQGVGAATDKATDATSRSAAADRAAATAKQANARAATQMATANRQAAGATGNLVANLNDIGMMMAAGQNPLQLAIQQGSQVTQVFGQAGAAGAVGLLKNAFVQMINPVNLAVYATIAGVAALVQWATSSSEAAAETDALTAATERQKAALEGIVAETERLRVQRAMLISGAATDEEQFYLDRNNELLRERAALDEQLARQSAAIGNARGAAALAELEARRAAINVEIGANNEKLVGLERQRELTESAERNRDVAEQLKAATLNVNAALQGADGSQLEAAFRVAFPAASALLGMAQSIVETIGGAAALQAAASGENYDATAIRTGIAGPDGIRAEGWGGGRFRAPVRGAGLPSIRVPSGGGGGGGGAAARDEADALQELIDGLEGEIAALRVTNPIQAEMLQHREALAGATEAERAKVEELIATREREAALVEAAQERAEFFEDTGAQAIDALIVKGQSFNEVLKQIGSSLIEAAIQATIFGSGPFGSIFGGTSILAGIIPGGKAAGGMIYGPGTGTSDSILTPLSNGEYVVNAKATARNRQLLEAINAGGRIGPGLATGGMAGGGDGSLTGRSGRQMPATVLIDLRGAQGDRAIEEKVRRGAAQVVALYDREGLAVGVQRVSRDPKRRG